MISNHIMRPINAGFPAQWAERAVALAMENSWPEAVEANQRILAVVPEDLSALNRLGRAAMELGQLEQALDAYMRTLVLSPSNTIAQKNLARVKALQAEAQPEVAAAKVEPRMLLPEPGKAVATSIKLKGTAVAKARLAVGEQVDLVIKGRALWIRDRRGRLLGAVEQRLARRIIGLMAGGNRYDALLAASADDAARVVIRETYQDPTQLGKVSFPATDPVKPLGEPRDSLLDEDDEDDEEAAAGDAVEVTEDSAQSADEDAASGRSLHEPYFG